MHFHCFQMIFLIFFFKQAWTNFIIPNNGIHRINSCKINQSFGGGPTSMIFSSILFVWYLIDCASSLRCMRLFWICYWANLVSHRGALAFVQVCSLPPHFPKFHEYACHCPCLMTYLIVLMFVWSSLIKCMSCVIFLN